MSEKVPLKVFKSVRANRNETLLEILGAVATSKHPISRLTIQDRLRVRLPGVKRTTYGAYVYSNIHKNTNFLEQKDFLRVIQKRPGRGPLYDVTVKGALASLFSSFVNESNESVLLDSWRVKDWGRGYEEPFSNVRNVLELRRIVDTICLHRDSLEDVSEDILKRSLRDPEELQRLIHEAKVTLTKKFEEEGKYVLETTVIPGSVSTVKLVNEANEPRGLRFLIAPDADTSKSLHDLITDDPSLQKTLEIYFLTILKTVAHDLKTKGKGASTHHYFSDSRTAVLTLTIPQEIASLLQCPEGIAQCTRKSFDDIVRPFLDNPDFAQGKTGQIYFYAYRYDTQTRDLYVFKVGDQSRDLLTLTPLEIKEKLHNLLKQMR